ncbi:hypothetical protein [Rhodomicrobium lacus]|uniref:hypothetical protein n=1 Tax=Rhodomicrobium lacus TaxID=2498452 RepID=UPI0026E2FAE7|nr:hypothetical protein [Rhodomicrobium lacus]WKW50797.1 hypothetical protein QMO75_16275 [Rhodomicrobium lacus]
MAADAHVQRERKDALVRRSPRSPYLSAAVDQESVDHPKIMQIFRIDFGTRPAYDDDVIFVDEVEDLIRLHADRLAEGDRFLKTYLSSS